MKDNFKQEQQYGRDFGLQCQTPTRLYTLIEGHFSTKTRTTSGVLYFRCTTFLKYLHCTDYHHYRLIQSRLPPVYQNVYLFALIKGIAV